MSKSLLEKYNLPENDSRYSILLDTLKPNFGLLSMYMKFIFKDRISIERVLDLNELIKKYKNLLQVNKIYPIKYDNFEELDDIVNNLIIKNEDVKFCKKFISNKYSFLIDDEVINLFGMLRKFESSHEKIQNILTSKLAAYKNIDDFKIMINSLLSNFNGEYSTDSLYIKAIENKSIVKYKDNRYLLVKVKNYKSCSVLGSTSWCISRSSSYYRSYTSRNNIQYILFDVKYPISDSKSLIGITTNLFGHIKHSYDRYNNHYYSKLSNIPKFIKNELIGVEKDDIIDIIKSGGRVQEDILNRFGIDNSEIILFNKYYYTKLNDIASKDYFNIDQLSEYLKSRKVTSLNSTLLDIYGKLIEKDDLENIIKLLDIKFINNKIIFDYFIKKNKFDYILDNYITNSNLSLALEYNLGDIKLDFEDFKNSIFCKLCSKIKNSNYVLNKILINLSSHYNQNIKVYTNILHVLKVNSDTYRFKYYINKFRYNNKVETNDVNVIINSLAIGSNFFKFELNVDIIKGLLNSIEIYHKHNMSENIINYICNNIYQIKSYEKEFDFEKLINLLIKYSTNEIDYKIYYLNINSLKIDYESLLNKIINSTDEKYNIKIFEIILNKDFIDKDVLVKFIKKLIHNLEYYNRSYYYKNKYEYQKEYLNKICKKFNIKKEDFKRKVSKSLVDKYLKVD